MEAKDHKLDVILKERQQWVVPVYQRQYTWGIDLISQFWEDIDSLSDNYLEYGKVTAHFFGAVIYSPADADGFGSIKIQNIVDGQQRLTTFHLFLAALLNVAKARKNDKYAARVSEYLFNAHSDAMSNPKKDIHKLWPSATDREYYLILISEGIEGLRVKYPNCYKKNGGVYKGNPLGNIPAMIRAYSILYENITYYFDYWLTPENENENSPYTEDQIFDALLNGLLRALVIVVIELGRTDDARAIFASLNGRSKPLSAFDLIRNDIFHRAVAKNESDEELYYGVWQRLENNYWQEIVKQGRFKRARTDHFMAHMLVAKTAEEITAAEVAAEYEYYAEKANYQTVKAEIDDIIHYAKIYENLDQYVEDEPEYLIGKFLKIWDSSVFYPLILAVGTSDISNEEKKKLYKRIEDYIVRRDIAGLTRKNYNKLVISIIKYMEKNGYSTENLNNWFKKNEGQGSIMPTLSDVQSGATNLDAYNTLRSPKLRYIFYNIEMYLRTQRQENLKFETDDLHIEHILPNQWAENWPLPNGLQAFDEDWSIHATSEKANNEKVKLSQEDISAFTDREAAKNTLGNLTLLTRVLNPSIGNAGWELKKSASGIGDSLLLLNRDVILVDQWDEDSIANRSKELSKLIDEIWPSD